MAEKYEAGVCGSTYAVYRVDDLDHELPLAILVSSDREAAEDLAAAMNREARTGSTPSL